MASLAMANGKSFIDLAGDDMAIRQDLTAAELATPGLSSASARDFISGLFRHLLGRQKVDEGEIGYWTQFLLECGDPIDVFERFTESEEYLNRTRTRDATRTAFPNGHFYSPVVDTEEAIADRDRIYGPRGLAGLDFRPDAQEQLFKEAAGHFASMPFDEDASGRHRYHYGNSSYGFGDACIYWALLASLRPARIVEIGSGYSSALALDAIDHFRLDTRCTFVDPYPALLLEVSTPRDPRHLIIAEPVQAVGEALASGLRARDLLFIDSSHVVKTGSDVLFEITEMLPRLAPGVIVHFHDIFYPFEYPEQWVLKDNKSWNELYMLQAFLQFNHGFEIVFFNDYFAKTRRDAVIAHAGPFAERLLLNPGGGLWLRRL